MNAGEGEVEDNFSLDPRSLAKLDHVATVLTTWFGPLPLALPLYTHDWKPLLTPTPMSSFLKTELWWITENNAEVCLSKAENLTLLNVNKIKEMIEDYGKKEELHTP